MTAHRARRLQKEIQDIVKDTHSGITITNPQGDAEIVDFTHFKGHFRGPPDTPYEGGRYEVDIRITPEYPFKPPEMRFITKIWHPNVSSQTGAICLDTLGTAWSPVLTLKSALISLQSLLSSPEPKDPQDAEVASMLLNRPEQFRHVAREWATRYAGAPRPPPGSSRTGASGSGQIDDGSGSGESRRAEEKERKREADARRAEAYKEYKPDMINKFVALGFEIGQVVEACEEAGISRDAGPNLTEQDYDNVTSYLFNEM